MPACARWAAIFLVLSALDVPGTDGLPRSFFALDGLLSLILIGGGRFALRVLLENTGRSAGTDEEGGVPSIVYGAGEAGAAVGRMAPRDPAMAVRVVGFVDDDPAKRDSRLHGVRIYGGLEAIPRAVHATGARQLVVAMPSASGTVIRRAMDAGRALGLTVRTVSPFSEMLGHLDQQHSIRPIRVEDLLRREPVQVDLAELTGYMNGATVLITGAGGSIGSELARQILSLGPRRLVVTDNNEAALWAIDRELAERRGAAGPTAEAALCDVRSSTAIGRLVEAVQPDVVFHAAALKHVPICEAHPSEAVLTNVFGTRHVLEACAKAGVSRFVLISTDKAVRPVSVMGATKRLAEIITIAQGEKLQRSHFAVRFGNVLGSSGSVVPIFQHQLAMGLPLTITHPDATRYFMTIPEAVSLILEAGAAETTGDIFILDMGDPVRIVDLATDIIRLTGRDPADVAIVYTGLRPGERLQEQLFYDHEGMEPTIHPRVLRATAADRPAVTGPLLSFLPALAAAAEASDDRRVRQLLAGSGILGQATRHPVVAVST